MAAEKATHQPLVGPDAADGNLWFPLCECTCPTVQLWEADMLTSASPAAARMVGFTVKCMDAKKKGSASILCQAKNALICTKCQLILYLFTKRRLVRENKQLQSMGWSQQRTGSSHRTRITVKRRQI